MTSIAARLHPSLAAWGQGGRRVATRRGHEVFARSEGGEGDAPALLFLHGFPTHSYDWRAQLAALSGRYRCVAFDFLGFGLSDKPRIAYSVFDQADVTEDVCAAQGVREAVVVSHDYGDTVHQILLHRQREGRLPFRIRRGVFLNGGVLLGEHRPLAVQWALANRTLGPVLSQALTARTVRRSFDRIFSERKIGEDEFAALWSGMSREGGTEISWRLLRYMHERPEHAGLLTRALTDADVPLSFVWGPDDPISGAHVLDALRGLMPDLDAEILPGVGHYPQIEAPDAVTEHVRDRAAR